MKFYGQFMTKYPSSRSLTTMVLASLLLTVGCASRSGKPIPKHDRSKHTALTESMAVLLLSELQTVEFAADDNPVVKVLASHDHAVPPSLDDWALLLRKSAASTGLVRYQLILTAVTWGPDHVDLAFKQFAGVDDVVIQTALVMAMVEAFPHDRRTALFLLTRTEKYLEAEYPDKFRLHTGTPRETMLVNLGAVWVIPTRLHSETDIKVIRRWLRAAHADEQNWRYDEKARRWINAVSVD